MRSPPPYLLRTCTGCGSEGYLRGPDCYGCWVTEHNPKRGCNKCGRTFKQHCFGVAGACDDYEGRSADA